MTSRGRISEPKKPRSWLQIDTIGANKVCQTPAPQSFGRETASHRRAISSITKLGRFISQLENLSGAALADSADQYHSKGFRCHLFSYSYALFCIPQSRIIFVFNSLRTLSEKHRGGNRVSPRFGNLLLTLTLFLPSTYTHFYISPEESCT